MNKLRERPIFLIARSRGSSWLRFSDGPDLAVWLAMTRMSSVGGLTLVLCLALGNIGCGKSSPGVAVELASVLAGEHGSSPRDKAVWSDVQKVYGARQNAPLWVTEKDVPGAVDEALKSVRRAAEHGLDPERYGAAALTSEAERLRSGKPDVRTPAALAKLDSDLAHAQLALGRDVAVGITDAPPPGVVVPDDGRAVPDIAGRFSGIAGAGNLAQWPDDVRPRHAQYAALQAALKKVLAGGAAEAPGAPEPIDEASKATPGEPADPSDRQRIAFNLERWRHMPDDLGERYIIVNIPHFHLWVLEGKRIVHNQRIIVGEQETQTPIFSADMNQVVFSPYWNIPESIANGETVPAILKNPAYLSKSNIEVVRRASNTVERVDPSKVDWNDPDVTKALSLRQRPGADNALGHVKFLMPNKHSVYLHDTPADQLFDKAGRSLSHGCIRLSEPLAMAKYVLTDQAEWPEEKIQAAMDSGEEKFVRLSKPIPVHIVYFTAWVDEKGTVEVFKDVYHRDRVK